MDIEEHLPGILRLATAGELEQLWAEASSRNEPTLMAALRAEQARRFCETLIGLGATAEEVAALERAAERIGEAIGAALLTARAVDEV